MSSPRHSRALALLLCVVPGWGHVYLGREAVGLLIFTLAASAAFAAFNVHLLYYGGHRLLLIRAIAGLSAAFLPLSLIDVWRRTSPMRRKRLEEEKARLLHTGMIAYLRDDLSGAAGAFRACLKLDPEEVEALVRLGVVEARRGDAKAARRWFTRGRRLDLDEKWTWEVEAELRALKSPAPPAVEAPPAPAGEKDDAGPPPQPAVRAPAPAPAPAPTTEKAH